MFQQTYHNNNSAAKTLNFDGNKKKLSCCAQTSQIFWKNHKAGKLGGSPHNRSVTVFVLEEPQLFFFFLERRERLALGETLKMCVQDRNEELTATFDKHSW